MRRLVAWTVLGACLGVSAETLYISDILTVPLRSGPSNAHRILHRGLPSGTALEVLEVDEEAGFTHIRTRNDMDGWIRSQYLVDEPIARAKLVQAQARVARLERQLNDQTSKTSELSTARSQAERSNSSLTRQVKALEQELAEIKRISADAISEHDKNLRLAQLNGRLRKEIDEIVKERQQLKDNVEQQWMLIGAGLVLAGLALGSVIKSRPRRSGWS